LIAPQNGCRAGRTAVFGLHQGYSSRLEFEICSRGKGVFSRWFVHVFVIGIDMIVGFNHNILYRGVGFHVQTEDGGLKSPNLVTLLYHGGTIIISQKTSYADILSVDNLNHVVEELAKEQHKGMLRRLTKGEFDGRIVEFGISLEGLEAVKKLEPKFEKAAVAQQAVIREKPAAKKKSEPVGAASVAAAADMSAESEPLSIEPAFDPVSSEERNLALNLDEALDDLIFSYLSGGNETK
jgi:hypothetical protein